MTANQHRLFEQAWPEGDYRLLQLGFVVDDLVGAAHRWAEVFRVGPFHVLPRMEVACTYRGRESGVDLQVAVAQAGPVQIELIQQFCARPSIYRDLVGPGESGFHQLCTVTADYDAKRAYYEGLGYEVACEIITTHQRVAYFDTSQEFGFITEVVEQTPAFLAQLGAIASTCAAWNGDDPVRILTREGYRTP